MFTDLSHLEVTFLFAALLVVARGLFIAPGGLSPGDAAIALWLLGNIPIRRADSRRDNRR